MVKIFFFIFFCGLENMIFTYQRIKGLGGQNMYTKKGRSYSMFHFYVSEIDLKAVSFFILNF